jgi:6-phosphogluconolactonase
LERGRFVLALSGGSTPKAIYQRLATAPYSTALDWSKVHVFWSDERAVAPEHPQSNYRMAMEAGLSTLKIPEEQIHRMPADGDLEQAARDYQQAIETLIPDGRFDLIMLGMGDDGHTASLFPETRALKEQERLVVANEVPQLATRRITFTYPLINRARTIVFYVLGEGKAETLERVLEEPYHPDLLPSQAVGTIENKALWLCDTTAAASLFA